MADDLRIGRAPFPRLPDEDDGAYIQRALDVAAAMPSIIDFGDEGVLILPNPPVEEAESE